MSPAPNTLYVSQHRGVLFIRWLSPDLDTWCEILVTFLRRFPGTEYRRGCGWALPLRQASQLERWGLSTFDEQFWQDGRLQGATGGEVAS
jgi:hypothetical protein